MEEFWYVLERSKAPWLVMVGCVFAVGLLLYGSHVESQLQFDGMFAPLTEPFRAMLHDRYGKAALGIIGSSFVGAVRIFCKDWKRLLR